MHNVRTRLLIARGVLVASAITGAIGAAARPGARPAMDEPSAVVRVDDSVDRAYRDDRSGGTVVDAPAAHVDTRGPVEVDAPAAHVEVDRGSVHVEAPFVNLQMARGPPYPR